MQQDLSAKAPAANIFAAQNGRPPWRFRLRPLFSRRRGAVAAAALSATLMACSPGSSDPLTSAREHLAKGNTASALIELKSALQKNPQSAEARFLLGRTLLERGDPVGAALELGKAVEAGHDRDEAIPLLARAELSSFRFKDVAQLYAATELKRPESQAELKAIVSQANTVLGNSAAALAQAKAALALDPKNATARLVQARLAAADGRIDDALALVAATLADHPKAVDAMQLQGDLYWLGKGDLKRAESAYLAAVAVAPTRIDAQGALTMLALTRNDTQAFRQRVAEMKKAVPGALLTRLHEAELALIDNDVKKAREGMQQLLRVAPDNDRVLQLAGVVELAAKAPGQAQAHFQKALQNNPNLPLARRLLAETYIRAGDSPRALQLLEPLLALRPTPGEALALAGEAHLQMGDLPTATEFFTRAAERQPEDERIGAALALSMIARGRADEGFAKLATLAKGKDGTTATLALVATRLSRGQPDLALSAVEDLRARQPELALPWLLRGRILASQRKDVDARASFEKAIALDGKYFPAVADLVGLDLQDGQPKAATERLQTFLKTHPKHADALVALALQKKRAGAAPAEVTQTLTEAIAAEPDRPAPRLALIEHQLSISDLDGALSTAQEAAARLPGDLVVLDSLGRVQLAKGDLQQALSSFGRIAAARPRSALAQLRLAEVERRSRRLETAQDRVLSALTLSPDLPAAQDAMLALALRDGRADSVLIAVRELQKRQPKSASGFALEGAIHASRKQWGPAIAAFEAAVQRSPARNDYAMRLHAMYVSAGRLADAQRFAARWEAANPKDARFLGHQGMMAILAKDFAQAETKFIAARALLPDDPQILNNLAWTLLQRGKPGALPLAEKANAAVPNTPIFMDTLASALAAEGQTARALELQRKAVERAPDDYGMRLNLARLLIKAGDGAAAKGELQRLSGLGSKFEGHEEVATLLKSL